MSSVDLICPRCHQHCPAEFQFCPKCGSPLHNVCPRCGYAVPLDFAYCPRCGTASAAPVVARERDTQAMLDHVIQRLIPQQLAERLLATRGRVGTERRLVTILFCDVKDSTARAARLDPEEALDIVNGAYEVLIPPVYEHEGTVAQLLGDAILAFFGAPIAHEDDPERAVRAALAITARAAEYAERLRKEKGIEGFGVRVGINTGLVVVGEVGTDLRVGYTAVGDTINVAARMEQLAPVGGVLITRDTYRQVRGLFEVEEQPPQTVKGKAEPVHCYLVKRARPRAWRMGNRGVEGIATRMVGREVELLLLQQSYHDAAETSETHVVTVVGEPGVGKSRLLDEFAAWLELHGGPLVYLRGRGMPESRSSAYSLWRDMFAYQFAILESDSTAAVMAKFRSGMGECLEPEQADWVGHLLGFDFGASPHVTGVLEGKSVSQVATASLVSYLRNLASKRTVVVLFEDLHWADESSLDLLAQVVQRLPRAALLAVGTTRPELLERRSSWGEGLEQYSRVELKPLTRRGSRALVQEILQKATSVPDELQQLIVEGAEGNPFYAEELVKMLIEDGAIVPGADEWQIKLDRLAQVRVPPTLTAVLQARLDALPREEKEVLQRASVVGREFWGSLVGELAADAVAAEKVSGVLSSLRGRELVYRREGSAFAGTEEYLFKHAILRDVTYETVLLKLRKRYHNQVATWLEQHAGERVDEYLALIAGHFELAGEKRRAVEYLLRAGVKAGQQYANPEGIEHYRRALSLLESAPEADAQGTNRARVELEEGLADLMGRIGRHAEAQEAYVRALALVDPEAGLARARLQRKISAAVEVLGQYNEALRFCDLAEAALGPRTDDPDPEWLHEWIEIHQRRMLLYYWSADWKRMAAAVERAGPVIVAHGTPRQRAGFHENLARVALRRDRYVISDETLAHFRAAAAAGIELHDPLEMASNCFGLGFGLLWRGDLDAAELELAAALPLAERTGDASSITLCLTYVTIVQRRRGQVEATRQYASRCLEAAAAAHMPAYTACARGNLAWAALREGDLEQAREHGRAALDAWAETPLQYPFQWTALWPMIELALREHAIPEAVQFSQALLMPEQMLQPEMLVQRLQKAIEAFDGGDQGTAAALLKEAIGLARRDNYA